MKIEFPRNFLIDTDNVPEDFEKKIEKSFQDYTEGTANDYTYQDKLAYIDRCRKLLHNAEDTSDCVMELMKEKFEYEVREYGNYPDESDFLSIEFMEECYEAARTNLYSNYTGDINKNDKIMELLFRAIKVVINY